MNQGWLSLEIQNWILGTGTLLSLMSSLEFFFWFLGTSLEFRNWILGTGTFLSLLSSLELISSCDKQLKKWSCHSVTQCVCSFVCPYPRRSFKPKKDLKCYRQWGGYVKDVLGLWWTAQEVRLSFSFKCISKKIWRVFQNCFKGVSRMFQRSCKKVLRGFNRVFRKLQGSSRVFHLSFKGFSRVFQRSFKDLSIKY